MSQVRTQPRMRRAPEAKSHRERILKNEKLDYTLVVIIILLLVFGLVMVYSTSYYTANQKYDNPAYWLLRQGFFASAGFVAMLIISKFDYHGFRRFTWALFWAVNAMLFYVLIFGEAVNGAKRWIFIGPINIQPSEIAKLSLILMFAHLLDMNIRKIGDIRLLMFTCVPILPLIGLVGVENFSTAAILISITGVMLFFASSKWKPLVAAGGVALIAAGILFSLKGYRSDRIVTWLHPESTESGYQTMQAIYAIGSGGLTGKGLGQSLQKLGFIPEAHNDMIFSIICEELGFFGAICLIALFLVLIFRLYRIVVNAVDLYGALLVVGIMAHIGIQFLVNVAVVTNTIPNTGVPLPFISYGGTSMCFLLAEMGVVLSVARTTQREQKING